MIPLYHDFSGETVLIFGGGAVGARKAERFADETRVVVVSPAFDDRLLGRDDTPTVGMDDPHTGDSAGANHHEPGIDLVRAAPDPEAVTAWIERADPVLVVAATDDRTINAAAESAALDADVLINRTDTAGSRPAGSVVVPATIEDDPVRVALSTGGTSPALAKALRERIEAEIADAGAMAALSGSLRSELKTRGVDPDKRREAIRRVVRSEGVWKGLQKGGSNGRKEADAVIDEVLDR